VALVLVAGLLLGGGLLALNALRNSLTPVPTYSAGCQAGTGINAVPLATSQTQIAATIAAVAAQRQLPDRALTIAYATAIQESNLANLSYGDRDSVGVFQQRPSQGWGTPAELQDPVYATSKFFAALVQVPDYTKLAIAVAAQDVQHSADGSAYAAQASEAAALTSAFTSGGGVVCWMGTGQPAVKLDLHGAAEAMDAAFGVPGSISALDGISRIRDGKADQILARPGARWAAANWLVANAAQYGITRVDYDGYTWRQGIGSSAWRHAQSTAGAGIVAS
jgi:hypothetical protein